MKLSEMKADASEGGVGAYNNRVKEALPPPPSFPPHVLSSPLSSLDLILPQKAVTNRPDTPWVQDRGS